MHPADCQCRDYYYRLAKTSPRPKINWREVGRRLQEVGLLDGEAAGILTVLEKQQIGRAHL
jgi:hypothetical protein